MTLISMQGMMDKLDPKLFVRVHRSYIISIAKIDAIERNRIVIGENWIPIGNYYKEGFKEILESHNLWRIHLLLVVDNFPNLIF